MSQFIQGLAYPCLTVLLFCTDEILPKDCLRSTDYQLLSHSSSHLVVSKIKSKFSDGKILFVPSKEVIVVVVTVVCF